MEEELKNYRTNTLVRLLLSTLLSHDDFVNESQVPGRVNFTITGSVLDNTASTLTFPDFDLLVQYSLCDETGFNLEANEKAPGYFRIKLLGEAGKKIVDALKKMFSEYDPKLDTKYAKSNFYPVVPRGSLLNSFSALITGSGISPRVTIIFRAK